MKIAFIGQKGIPAKQGGVERHVHEIATRLAELDFDVSVYSRPHYTKSKPTNYKGINIINLPSIKSKHFDAISHSFLASVHALFQGYDVIHYQGVGPSLLSWIPRLFNPSTRVVGTFHCLDRNHQKWNKFAQLMLALGERAVCLFPHQTIVVSKTLKEYSREKYGREAVYIPNGADITVDKTAKNSDILKTHDLKKGSYFLAACRITKGKGLDTLIRAYLKLDTDKKLIIAGASSNSGNHQKQLIKMSKGNKNIIFTGQLGGKDLSTIFKNAYAFVQPSESEGLSIALLEAVSYKIPTIVSNIVENLEAVNGYGLIFENKSVSSLANKMNYALQNKEEITEFAKNASKRVKSKYNWKKISIKTGELYRYTCSEEVVQDQPASE